MGEINLSEDKKLDFSPADLSEPWFKIDNASNLYAAARNKKWCRTYRTCLVLDHEIDKAVMQKALTDTARRFPSMCGRLKDGLFWSYFERTDEAPVLCDDTNYPYRPIELEGNNQPNFRISVYKNRVAMEVFHSLSDGSGTNLFLATLTGRYYELKGENIPKSDLILDVNEAPRACEVEDSYFANSDPKYSAKNVSQPDVYLTENEPEENYIRLHHGLFRVEDAKRAAKKYSLTITEYLTAAIIYMFIKCEKEPINKPLSVSVPIDLRKRFPSFSTRNFVYMTDVSFDPKGRRDIEFTEICDSIRGELSKRAAQDYLVACISANVAAQSSKLLKPIPNIFKRAFLTNSYKKSQQSYTTFFSNLGEFPVPPELAKHILRAESCLGSTPHMHFGCASVSVNGLFNFTFCTGNHDLEKQKFFFRFLSSDGIPVRVESNIWE